MNYLRDSFAAISKSTIPYRQKKAFNFLSQHTEILLINCYIKAYNNGILDIWWLYEWYEVDKSGLIFIFIQFHIFQSDAK